MSRKAVKAEDHRLFWAAVRRIPGGWCAAVAAAGLSPSLVGADGRKAPRPRPRPR